MKIRLYALVLSMLAGLGVAFAGQEPIQITLSVDDGSLLKGTMSNKESRITTTYATVPFAWSQVRSLDTLRETRSIRLTMENQDVLKGHLDQASFAVDTILGPVTVPLKMVENAAFAPLIYLDGGAEGWRVDTANVKDWSFVNQAGTLQVDQIVPTIVQRSGGGQHSRVHLSREVELDHDFVVSAGLNWRSKDDKRVMKGLYIELLGEKGQRLALVGYGDAWIGHHGARSICIGDKDQSTLQDTMPCVGDADVIIARHDGTLSILWGDQEIMQGESAQRIAMVRLTVSHYARSGPTGNSIFGTAGVDYLRIKE